MMALRGYKFCLYKAYFDKGYSITSYPKWIFAIAALKISSVTTAIILGLFYSIACFLIGWAWYRWRIIEAETEVGNKFNLFVREVRKSIKRNI